MTFDVKLAPPARNNTITNNNNNNNTSNNNNINEDDGNNNDDMLKMMGVLRVENLLTLASLNELRVTSEPTHGVTRRRAADETVSLASLAPANVATLRLFFGVTPSACQGLVNASVLVRIFFILQIGNQLTLFSKRYRRL